MKRICYLLFLPALIFSFFTLHRRETKARAYSEVAAPRFDEWRIIGPGGGGAQFLPTISPHDVHEVLVRCDMTGAYISHDDGESWRMFNLRGVVRYFVFDPVDPKVIYAQTSGLFRSTDDGKTWSLVYPKPERIDKIVMSDDHAEEQLLHDSQPIAPVTALAVDPQNSNHLYAIMEKMLRASDDRGKSWKDVAPVGDAFAVYIDPQPQANDHSFYLANAQSVSTLRNGKMLPGAAIPNGDFIISVSVGFEPNGKRCTIYAVGATAPLPRNQLNGGRNLYRSADGGMTWQTAETRIAPNSPLSYRSVATCAMRPEVAYVSYHSAGAQKDAEGFFGVMKTTDGGESWLPVWKESRTGPPQVRDPWISERFGASWSEHPIHLGVSPTNPDVCYGTDFGRTVRTLDGGQTWKAVYSKQLPNAGYTSTGLDVTSCYGVHFDPFHTKRMFISYTDIGLFRSEDGGRSWQSSTNGVPSKWINTTYWLAFDPEVSNRVWAVMSGIHDLPRPKMWRQRGVSHYNGGVAVSNDGGATWKESSNGMPPTAATHILLDPKSPVSNRTLYVTGFGRGVFKSNDGGKSWALKNEGLQGKEPFAWRLALDRSGTLYLIVARRSDDGSWGNDLDGLLYRSRDGAEHWEKITLPQGVNGPNGIAVDSENPQFLYLACWGRQTVEGAVGGGVFASSDAGKTWRNSLNKDQHVYDVTIDSRNPKILYACGFESSAWRSDNRGGNWTRIQGYNFKWGHRVIPDPMDAKKIYITTFGGSVWHGPAQGDPQAVEDIVTTAVAVGR